MEKAADLFLITNHYPYGNLENTFITPEISVLNDLYYVTIISMASDEEYINDHNTPVPDDARVVRNELGSLSKLRKVLGAVASLTHKPVWSEFLRIVREKQGGCFTKCIFALKYDVLARLEAFFLSRVISEDEKRPAIVYTYWYSFETLAAVYLARNNPRIKIITRAHGDDLYNQRVKKGSRQPFRQYMDPFIDQIHFISDDGYRYYIDTFMNGLESSRYFVSRLGINRIDDSAVSTLNNEIFTLVSCAYIIPLKRIHYIVKALESMPASVQIKWIHFGGGELYEDIVKRAEQLSASHPNITCELPGNTSNERILDYYAHNCVNAFISTSSTEGLPVSVMEALAYGIPIIGTDVGSTRETIEGNGVLLPADPEISDICDAIMSIYESDKNKKNEMSRKSQEIWEIKFNGQENAKVFSDRVKGLFYEK